MSGPLTEFLPAAKVTSALNIQKVWIPIPGPSKPGRSLCQGPQHSGSRGKRSRGSRLTSPTQEASKKSKTAAAAATIFEPQGQKSKSKALKNFNSDLFISSFKFMSHIHIMILVPVLKTHSIKRRKTTSIRGSTHTALLSTPKQNHLAQGLLGVNHQFEGFA